MQFIYYGTLQRRRERLRSLRSRPRPQHAPPHHRLHVPPPHAHALPPYRPLPSEVRARGLACMQGVFMVPPMSGHSAQAPPVT